MKPLARRATVKKRIILDVTKDTRACSALLFKWKTIRSIISHGHEAHVDTNSITMRQYKIGPV